MGTPTLAYQGSVVSWAGTNNAILLTALGEHEATLTIDSGLGERTQYGASLLAQSYGAGLSTWECTFRSRLFTTATAQVGYAGNFAVSSAAMYASHVRSYTLSINAIAERADEYQSAAVLAGYGQFLRGLISASGSAEVLVDDTTALSVPYTPTTSIPTGTFTLTGTANDTLAASILPTGVTVNSPVAGLNTATYSFNTSGNITVGAGSLLFSGYASSALGLPDFDYATPANGNLVFATKTGSRTFTGGAFWKNITINHSPANYVDVSITAQGYGILTSA